jgi:hypothetical protein
MPSIPQWVLIVLAIVFAVMAANCSDRMARELRETGEARYENPYVIPGRGLRRFQSDLQVNDHERFPHRTLRRKAQIYSGLACLFLAALLLTLPGRHSFSTKRIESSKGADR